MAVFPQLSSGAGAQYPAVRRREIRSAMNYLRDGSVLNYADRGFAIKRWDLAFQDLTDTESAAIQSLFEAVEGRRGEFTFVDPTANLLASSEDLHSDCWSRDPMLQVAEGAADPFGGQRASRLINASQTIQSISQSLDGPSWFRYTSSVYVRSAAETSISLSRSSGTNTHSRLWSVGPGWTRCVLSGALTGSESSVKFSLGVAPATALDVFGMQAEAQPCASAYKRTGERSAVYSNARFDQDILRLITDGPDQHRFHLRIVAKD